MAALKSALLGLILMTVGGESDHHLVLVNDTGLAIARIEIDDRKFETIHSNEDRILISISHAKDHHLRIVFRGGADVNWPHLDLRGAHEIIFSREKNKIAARID